MLDFGTLEKAQPAIYPVRYACIEQGGFDHAALGVAAVQNGHVLASVAFAQQLANFVHNPARLGQIAGLFHHTHRLARAGIGA